MGQNTLAPTTRLKIKVAIMKAMQIERRELSAHGIMLSVKVRGIRPSVNLYMDVHRLTYYLRELVKEKLLKRKARWGSPSGKRRGKYWIYSITLTGKRFSEEK